MEERIIRLKQEISDLRAYLKRLEDGSQKVPCGDHENRRQKTEDEITSVKITLSMRELFLAEVEAEDQSE